MNDANFGQGIHFLVGRNGSGKSTFLRLLAGLERADEGFLTLNSLKVDDREKVRAYKAASGYICQDYSISGRTSVKSFLQYGAWLRGVDSKELTSRSNQMLDLVGLSEKSGERVGKLSGGMQRRLGLAVEMSNKPTVCLLDEPASGLDFEARLRIHELLKGAVDAGAIVILASHDESELNQYRNATYHVLEQGRLLPPIHGVGHVSVESLLEAAL